MRVAIKEKRLADLSSSSVDPAAMGKAAKDFTSSRSVWINRRRMCMEAVEILADGMGKSTKSVMVSAYPFGVVCAICSSLSRIVFRQKWAWKPTSSWGRCCLHRSLKFLPP